MKIRGIRISATTEVDGFDKLIAGDAIKEVINQRLASGLSKEIAKLTLEEDGCITRSVTESFMKESKDYKASVMLVNPYLAKDVNDYITCLEEKIVKLSNDNESLRKKNEEFRKVGLSDVLEVMNKAEIMQEFCEKLQGLTEEYGGRMV